ncbi:MAG: ORF6N domain-containing protein, partial [Ginsengibacter sp.]
MQVQFIQQKIFEVRGQKVMLDFDLATLYEVETRVFNLYRTWSNNARKCFKKYCSKENEYCNCS